MSENLYWQFFCGFDYLQHQLPIDPSSLTRWRERIGSDGWNCCYRLRLTRR
jgi:transposase, IS5 family